MLRCHAPPQCGRAPLRHHGRRESSPAAAPGVVVRCARGAPQVSGIEAASPGHAAATAVAAKAEGSDARPSLAERLRLGSLLEDGLSYKESFIVRCYEVGINKTATVETIANLLQEVGCNHAQSVGFSTDGFATTTTMRKLGLIWVTNRMHIEIYKYPAWGDVVEIETWCQEDGRIGTRRDWILKDLATGEVTGRATSRSRESGVSEPPPAIGRPARVPANQVSGKCFAHVRSRSSPSLVEITKPERINMAGPSDALKPERFAGGENFKRWQTRVKFWLMSLRIWWVISPVLPLTEEQDRNFESDNSTCVGCILTLLSDQLYDIHMHHEVARDLWETLDRMYTESDAGRELYVNEQYHEYKMVDDRSVVEQAHEIQLLVGELAHFDCVLPNKFVVGGIIAKLPPTWRSFATALKHKKEAMTVESLIATLDVEEKARSKDVPRSGPMDSGTSNANVVEGKSGGKNKNKTNWKPKAKQNTDFKKKKKNLADLTCFVCGESGHIARKCRNRKGKKGDGQKTANVAIADAGNSGLPTVAPS